ncbi:unnamed protein product [Cochlearia groenlandica]
MASLPLDQASAQDLNFIQSESPHQTSDCNSELEEGKNQTVDTLTTPDSPKSITFNSTTHELSSQSSQKRLAGKLSEQDESSEPAIAQFRPNIGAWLKPLHFAPPATPSEPATPCTRGEHESLWPSINDGVREGLKKKQTKGINSLYPNLPITKLPPPALKEDGSLRFPWAARMNPASRNLYRVANPTFRLDGTPEVLLTVGVFGFGGDGSCGSPAGFVSGGDDSLTSPTGFERISKEDSDASMATLGGKEISSAKSITGDKDHLIRLQLDTCSPP